MSDLTNYVKLEESQMYGGDINNICITTVDYQLVAFASCYAVAQFDAISVSTP